MAVEYNDKNWKEILANDKLMAEFIGVKPEIEYSVGDDEGYCYSPKNVGFSWPGEQKAECERWLKEHGHLKHFKGYSAIKQEHYPRYHCDLNALFDLMIVLQKKHFIQVKYQNYPIVGKHSVSVCVEDDENNIIDADMHSAYYFAILMFIKTKFG